MTINLNKGERINLTKESPGSKQLGIGLGWDLNKKNVASDFKLDLYVFILGSKGKIPSAKHLVFSENLQSPDGSTIYSGDSIIGQIDGDQKTVRINLNKVDYSLQELVFIVTIHKAKKREQNFKEVSNAYIRIYNEQTTQEVTKYKLEETFFKETAVEFGRLYLKDNQWRFQAVGNGYNSGLQGFVDQYI